MVHLAINGLTVSVENGSTLLEAARFYGFPIPTLCHMDGLNPFGACRLCVVEIGKGTAARLVTACTYPALPGLHVRTASSRVIRARKIIIELLLASCPRSKTIQDLASAHDVRRQRFRQEDKPCILCGRCVAVCREQMQAGAIGFRGRGENRSIGTPFDLSSDLCRLCGACMFVCPACQLRCTPADPAAPICGACANLSPPCLEKPPFDDLLCYMQPCLACQTEEKPQERSKKP